MARKEWGVGFEIALRITISLHTINYAIHIEAMYPYFLIMYQRHVDNIQPIKHLFYIPVLTTVFNFTIW